MRVFKELSSLNIESLFKLKIWTADIRQGSSRRISDLTQARILIIGLQKIFSMYSEKCDYLRAQNIVTAEEAAADRTLTATTKAKADKMVADFRDGFNSLVRGPNAVAPEDKLLFEKNFGAGAMDAIDGLVVFNHPNVTNDDKTDAFKKFDEFLDTRLSDIGRLITSLDSEIKLNENYITRNQMILDISNKEYDDLVAPNYSGIKKQEMNEQFEELLKGDRRASYAQILHTGQEAIIRAISIYA